MPVSLFSLFLSFVEKEYQTESNWPETLRRFFMDRKKPTKYRRWTTGATRHPQGCPPTLPLPRGPPDLSPTPKTPINREKPREKPRLGVPQLQASDFTKNQSGSVSAPCRGGGVGNHCRRPSSSSRWSPWRGGSSSPSGLRVCTSSYVFDLSLSLVFSLMFPLWPDLDVSRALLL